MLTDTWKEPQAPCVSDISRQGGQISNEWVKNPLVQSFGRQRARGKQQARPGGPDLRAQIDGAQQIPDPPCLSAFKQGGGGSGIVGAAPNGHDRGIRINGSCAAPTFSAVLSLTRMGPPSTVSSFCPPCPCCRVSLIRTSPLARVVFSSSHHPLISRHASHLHISFSPKGESVSPVFTAPT